MENKKEIDSKYVKIIVQEFSRCQWAFEQFLYYGKEFIIKKNRSKKVNLFTYNAYSSFIQHLYEFLIACYKRDINKYKSRIESKDRDKYINSQVDRILDNSMKLLEENKAPSWFNDKSYYQDNCPDEFGKEFRRIRNRLVHVEVNRFNNEKVLGLDEFFSKYHKYIVLLYREGLIWWSIKNYKKITFEEVTNFNNLITDKKSIFKENP